MRGFKSAHLHVIARSIVTKQSRREGGTIVRDCFALLAMTTPFVIASSFATKQSRKEGGTIVRDCFALLAMTGARLAMTGALAHRNDQRVFI